MIEIKKQKQKISLIDWQAFSQWKSIALIKVCTSSLWIYLDFHNQQHLWHQIMRQFLLPSPHSKVWERSNTGKSMTISFKKSKTHQPSLILGRCVRDAKSGLPDWFSFTSAKQRVKDNKMASHEWHPYTSIPKINGG